MWRGMIGILVAVSLLGGAAAAETAEEAPQPKCRKAEINPITGHVLCIDPLGAPVEPPPAEAKLPCKPEEARGQWSYGPGCAPEPEGM
jgi:hypothetical protein